MRRRRGHGAVETVRQLIERPEVIGACSQLPAGPTSRRGSSIVDQIQYDEQTVAQRRALPPMFSAHGAEYPDADTSVNTQPSGLPNPVATCALALKISTASRVPKRPCSAW